ncbi:hypothetical protein SAMN05216404_11311 [Nitrosospira multiformis]|uniref:Uncharacterized protein n=1 Tax=Nitrosospira multiformis TaxID=1231 RepID=A0A1H8MK76_9PROT|nr:hypothetical protein SAMN05216404_11311 [Nitrosospira multiformis]
MGGTYKHIPKSSTVERNLALNPIGSSMPSSNQSSKFTGLHDVKLRAAADTNTSNYSSLIKAGFKPTPWTGLLATLFENLMR